MKGLLSWLQEAENRFFALHLVAVVILAIILELALPGWTLFSLPAVLLVVVVSFLLNYPTDSIKAHGLFSEYLIELRLLWLVMLSVFFEYVVYQFFEQQTLTLVGAVLLVIGILVLFYARTHLQDKIAKARGFN